MKKIICLILSAIVLVSSAFAVVDFSQPSDEVIANIKNAIIKDGSEVFHNQYWPDDPPSTYKPKKVRFVNVVANVNGNYVISFMYDDACVDGWADASVGDYVIDYYSYGYGIYSSADDKLISIPNAYDKGIITNEDMYEIWKNQKGKREEINFIINKADVNHDGEIDILDVVSYRAYIVKSDGGYWYYILNNLGDLNGDKARDIIDIAMLRDIIVNSK